jgi:hypothetical protein
MFWDYSFFQYLIFLEIFQVIIVFIKQESSYLQLGNVIPIKLVREKMKKG